MPPKRRGKKKKSKVVVEKGPNLLTPEEYAAREQIYINRLLDVKKCINFIDDALLEVNAINDQRLLEEKWIDFVTCNPLPKPYIPPDIRRFYTKLEYMERESLEQSMNWLLMVNERSILSQDIFRKVLTRRELDATIRENIGEQYSKYVRDSLDILKRIENYLDNDVEVSKCPVDILDDIVRRRSAIQTEIMELLDRFTYRIVSSENAEMKSIDAITAEYFFAALDFWIHIWCLKNVAIRFSHLNEPRLMANFHSIKLILQIPIGMLKENLVIRALHLNFDHLSENAKSFNQLGPIPTETLNAGILDLHDCLVNERSMQIEIQTQTLENMIKNRKEYEEKMQQYTEQLEKSKQRSGDNADTKKVKKIAKPTHAPPEVGPDTVPDIYEDFLKEEQRQFENYLETVYKPELLNLTFDEINLRKYSILGGIYQLYYIEKPYHTDFGSFNITWHKNDSTLVVDKKFKIATGLSFMRPSEMFMPRRTTIRMTVYEADTRVSDPDTESPWFVITIELPEYLCFWGNPVACHFEETTRRVEKVQQDNIGEENIKAKKTKKVLKSKADSSAFKLLEPLDLSASSPYIKRNTIYQDSLATSLLLQRKTELLSRTSMDSLHINDFSLLKTLTKPQIRHIERHIVPRIISSYKFPKEIHQEETQLSSKKARRKGGRIIRRRLDISDSQQLSNRQFTFDQQNNPERIYPKFPYVRKLRVIPYLEGKSMEPETFGQLLNVVEHIKKEYGLRKDKILNLQPLEQETVTENKLIKKMLENWKQPSTTPSAVGSTTAKTSILSPTEEDAKLPDTEINEPEPEETFFPEDVVPEVIDLEESEEKYDTETYSHWTTRYIIRSNFDRENKKMVIYTDRLGNIGLAFNRYQHFPFKYWSMEPSADDPTNEVIFTLDTQYVRFVLRITSNGIRGHITDPSEGFVRNPKMYLVIEDPIKDLKELKKLLQSRNLNIFAEPDASFYVKNGYFKEKHLATEMHIYNCMAIHSTQMHFSSSIWNRLADRRDILLKFYQYPDSAENIVEVRIKPGEAFFVDVKEICSDDLDVIKLDYELTWRNIGSYSDLHYLIASMYPGVTESRCKISALICFIKDLLSEVRILSFS